MGAKAQRERADELRQRGAAFLSLGFAAARVAPLIGETGPAGCSVDIARVKGGRATLRYRFASGGVVYGKAYEQAADGRRLFDTLCALWEAGFNSSRPFRVPEPVAFLEEENVVLMREARGTQLSLRLAESPPETAAAAVRAAARWLLALHSARLSCLHQEGPWERLKIFRECDALARSASAHPAHAPALLEFLGYVHELAPASAAPPVTPTHGVPKPTSFFVDSETVTAIDLDTVSLSDPAVDVAKFVSKLKYRKLFKADGESVRAARLASEFLDEYAGSAGRNLTNLPYYLALYCLKEFSESFAAPKADRSACERAERLCRRELQRCLREGAPERSPPSREKTESPTGDVIAAWSALCSTPTDSGANSHREACEAKTTAVQPKHTARLALRLTTHPSSRLYAKSYPEHVGRRCAKVTAALWASGFGPDSPYRVPEVAAFVPDRSVLLMHAAQGVPLSAVLETGSVADVARGARNAACWLAALHRSPVRVGSPERDWISLKAFRVPASLIEVCARFPGPSAPLLEILHQLKHRVATLVGAASIVQTHGGYRPKHVFIADGVTTAIDLDRSLPADPAKDVAEFVSDLRFLACDGRYDRHLAERAVDVFLEEYLSQAPERAPRVSCYSACRLMLGLLKSMMLAGVTDPEWPERFEFYREAIQPFL